MSNNDIVFVLRNNQTARNTQRLIGKSQINQQSDVCQSPTTVNYFGEIETDLVEQMKNEENGFEIQNTDSMPITQRQTN